MDKIADENFVFLSFLKREIVESHAPYTEASLLACSARCRVTEIKKRGKEEEEEGLWVAEEEEEEEEEEMDYPWKDERAAEQQHASSKGRKGEEVYSSSTNTGRRGINFGGCC